MSVQVYGPDGKLRSDLAFSTSLENRFFNGVAPPDTVELQVSINGSTFSADPALSDWGDGAWTIPNPKYQSDGMALLNGANRIEIRSLLPSGSVTPACSVVARLVDDAGLGVVALPPTNISVERQDRDVVICAEPGNDGSDSYSNTTPQYFKGVNVYASAYAGGGGEGYYRLNISTVEDPTETTETSQFATMTVDVVADSDAEGVHVADPMYFRMLGRQEDADDTILQLDYNQKFEIPETAQKLQVSTTISTLRGVSLYKFTHNRGGGINGINVSSLQSVPLDDPLYYVVTAIYYDPVLMIEYESTFSEEVVGRPLRVTTAMTSIPTVNRQEIVRSFVSNVFRTNPQVKVEAGSVLRDTVIDPFASQSERLRFIFDFFQRARTPTLLLQIDDPANSGASLPVAASQYKQALQQALYLGSAASVQTVIDNAFDAMANNFGLTRKGGTRAVGEITFYTLTRPTSTINLPLGTQVTGGGVTFAVTRSTSINVNRLASFYDPISGRYQVTVPVRAVQPGALGNVAPGQVTTVATTIGGSIRCVNTGSMTGGRGRESNYHLAQRVSNRLASVDSGTARGYLQTAADTPGVQRANVVDAGDPLMYRDIYEGVHKGGKVDVWVQGTNLATLTDSFAFSFEIGADIQFEPVGNPNDYLFRAVDPSLSSASPIVEMLDYPDSGYLFQNVTTGEVFNLAAVAYPTYDTIQLSTEVAQPSVTLTDVCLGSYRKRTASSFTLPRQPVASITDVSGTVSGTLPASSYYLNHPDAPLGIGRSSLASDSLQVVPVTNSDGTLTPSGNLIDVVGESHVLVGSYPEYLNYLGANYLSIVVTSADGTTTYRGPDDPSGDPDYTLDLGSSTTAVSLTRTTTGDIPSGTTVLVSYSHDENFSVTYQTNLIVSNCQDAVNANKHATADVLVKDAVPIPLDIDATVILIPGRQSNDVDNSLRTNLSNFFTHMTLSDPVRQSDVVDIIEGTVGVSYVVLPLSKMVPQDGASILREEVSTDLASESVVVSHFSTNSAIVYLLRNSLAYATVDGGGSVGDFVGVFQDDVELALLTGDDNLSSLGVSPGRAFIIGDEGLSIEGISDDATLTAAGYVTATSKQERRRELTANTVMISTDLGSSPSSYTYAATYVVGDGKGAKNVDPGKAQYCTLGTLTLTYDSDSA